MTAQPSNPYVNPAPKISRTPPSTSDFIADVEKAAHRSLTEPEGMYFDVYYKSTDVIVSETDSVEYDNSLSEHILKYHESKRTEAATYDSQMRHKVGTELIRVGIYPIAQYLSPTGAV